MRKCADYIGNSPFKYGPKIVGEQTSIYTHTLPNLLVDYIMERFHINSHISVHEVVSVTASKLNGQNFHSGTVLVC